MSDAFEKRIKKHIIGKPHRFLAVVPLGFEQTLINELDFIRQETVTELPHIIGDGKVEFTAKITEAWKAVAFSRIANRVLMHIADFKAENFRELEKKASEIPWELYLDDNHLRRESRPTELGMTEPNGWELSEAKVQRRETKDERYLSSNSINIHVTCKHSRLYHSDAIAERLYNIIKGVSLPLASSRRENGPSVLQTKDKRKTTEAASRLDYATPSAGTPRNAPNSEVTSHLKASKASDIAPQTSNIYVHFLDDRCTIWLDLAGEELYKRGHERYVNDAPLKETIAAAMIFEAISLIGAPHRPQSELSEQPHSTPTTNHQPLATIIDPMAGSGTFSLEAAYIANKLIPGKCRDFALKHQPAFKEATWKYITNSELGVRNSELKKIITSDISERAIEIIKHNVECSPLAGIELTPLAPLQKDFFAYTAKEIADASNESSPIIVLNPPYGKRLDFDAPKLYTRIGRKLTELAHDLKQFNKALTVAILAPKDDCREGSKYTCTSNLLRECAALSPEHNPAAKQIATSHGGFSLNVFIAQLNHQ
ncbi:MAG: RNA methyltransferase [Fibrobacter sp.]|uniref:THUMP domain-containing class I SAM-dependent RNA methyltransferase n=1 Tax=Fibrobacter sp. TaxID=35828 RepID=UPI0025BEBB4C|nr:RNA methyltransferase [Fibrobacter sp.]MBQ7081125.1 RNA methyltransferase [Fibrobacter sp.]